MASSLNSFVFTPNFNFSNRNMCNENVFSVGLEMGATLPPPGVCFFLLSDGTDFLLSDNSNFLLACNSANYFLLSDGSQMKLSDGTNLLLS